MTITTSISIINDNPLVVAEALREFAGRLERGEIAPGQSGEITERCNICDAQAEVAWEIATEDEDKEEQDDGSMSIDTPFGRMTVVPLGSSGLDGLLRN